MLVGNPVSILLAIPLMGVLLSGKRRIRRVSPFYVSFSNLLSGRVFWRARSRASEERQTLDLLPHDDASAWRILGESSSSVSRRVVLTVFCVADVARGSG